MSTPTPLPSRKTVTVAVSAALLGVQVFFIGLRCYSSARIAKKFNYNDALMIGAVGIYTCLLILLIDGVRNGIGGHTLSAGIDGIRESLKFIFFLEIIYVILTSVMKASLAITLLQWAQKKTHIFLLKASIVIDFVICLIVVEYFLVQCSPVSYTWDFVDSTKKGTCLPTGQQVVVGELLSGVTISLDMIFLFVPFFMMRGRGVNKHVKLCIYGIFGLGVLASVANFIRLAALVKLKASADPLFDAAPVFVWSATEVSIGISAAGIIELRPLMQRLRVRGFEQSLDQFVTEDRRPIRLDTWDTKNKNFPRIEHLGPEPRDSEY